MFPDEEEEEELEDQGDADEGEEWFQLPGLVQALVLFCRQNKALCCLPLRVRIPTLEHLFQHLTCRSPLLCLRTEMGRMWGRHNCQGPNSKYLH